MVSSQTRKEVKQTLRDTKWWIQYYKKRAGKCWKRHKVIRGLLFSEVTLELVALVVFGNQLADASDAWKYGIEIGILVLLGITLLWDYFSNYTRKAEVFDIANMECRLVKVKLNALWDEMENFGDDEVRRKHWELNGK